MAVEWNVNQGDFDPNNVGDGGSYIDILFNSLKDGVVTDASTESVTLEHNGQSIVFEGSIILNGGEPQAGMINTLRIYEGDTLVAEATGYWLDIGVIGDAADQLQSGGSFWSILQMLRLQPTTFNGSNDDDYWFDSDFDGVMYGRDGNDNFYGAEGDDLIVGGRGKDKLNGAQGEDELKGGKGKDLLSGGSEDDILNGGKGSDQFLFAEDLGNGPGQAGVDTIVKFQSGSDTLALGVPKFGSIGNNLGSGEFHVGSNAQDANDYIIYKQDKGALYYDADGNGAGSKIKFAVIENTPNLSHTDFDMIAP